MHTDLKHRLRCTCAITDRTLSESAEGKPRRGGSSCSLRSIDHSLQQPQTEGCPIPGSLSQWLATAEAQGLTKSHNTERTRRVPCTHQHNMPQLEAVAPQCLTHIHTHSVPNNPRAHHSAARIPGTEAAGPAALSHSNTPAQPSTARPEATVPPRSSPPPHATWTS